MALSHGPAGQVTAVTGAYPALTTILALLFLTERVTAVQAGGVLLAVTGVLLVGIGG